MAGLHDMQGICHLTLCDLLSTFSLNHRDGKGAADGDEALANIFTANEAVLNKFISLSDSYNVPTFRHNDGNGKSKLIIKEMDQALVHYILVNLNVFPTYFKIQHGACGPNHLHQCCSDCDHKCACKKECSKSKSNQNVVGSCKQSCVECGTSYTECSDQLSMCCQVCSTCIQHGNDLPREEPCENLELRNSINAMNKLGNIPAHTVQGEKFSNGEATFSDLPKIKTWEERLTLMRRKVEYGLNYLVRKHTISSEIKEERLWGLAEAKNAVCKKDEMQLTLPKSPGVDFCGTDNHHYIIHSKIRQYMRSNNFNTAKDCNTYSLHPNCIGDHYLANNNGKFYIIQGNKYRRTTNMNHDTNSVEYSLHRNCQGGDFYMCLKDRFYIIYKSNSSIHVTKNMNNDEEGKDVRLPPEVINGLSFWGCGNHFYYLQDTSSGPEYHKSESSSWENNIIHKVHDEVIAFLSKE